MGRITSERSTSTAYRMAAWIPVREHHLLDGFQSLLDGTESLHGNHEDIHVVEKLDRGVVLVLLFVPSVLRKKVRAAHKLSS